MQGVDPRPKRPPVQYMKPEKRLTISKVGFVNADLLTKQNISLTDAQFTELSSALVDN